MRETKTASPRQPRGCRGLAPFLAYTILLTAASLASATRGCSPAARPAVAAGRPAARNAPTCLVSAAAATAPESPSAAARFVGIAAAVQLPEPPGSDSAAAPPPAIAS